MGIILKWKKILRSKLTKEAFILKKTTKFFFKFLKNSSTRSEHAVTLKLIRSRNLQQISDGTVCSTLSSSEVEEEAEKKF
jgi:hypothetical protein